MKWNSRVAAWATTLALIPLVAFAAGDESDLEARVSALEAQVATLNDLHGITTTTTIPEETTTTIAGTTTLPEATTTIPGGTTTIPDETTTTVFEATTTTLVEPTTTTTLLPEPAPTDFSAISVVGCSNVNHAVSGYLAASSVDRVKNTAWGGWYFQRWAFRPWPAVYAEMRPATGYDASWVVLCEVVPNALSVAVTQVVLDKVWAIDPGIPIFISPLHMYPDESCSVTGGNQIPTAGIAIADEMAASNPLVFRGPDIGPLTTTMVKSNGCHLNDAGIAFLGTQLVEFFDGG